MPTLHVSSQELLEAANQLEGEELDAFLEALQQKRARRKVGSLSARETQLLQRINAPLDPTRQARFLELEKALEANQAGEPEKQERLELIEWREEDWAERLEAVVELAHLRGRDFPSLFAELNLRSSAAGQWE